MDRRRRRGFNLPKRPYTDPPKSSLKPDSKPTVWVGGAKGSFAKGSPAAPVARLTPQSVGEAVLKLSAEVKRLFHVDLADPPDWVNYRLVEDNAHVIDFRFPPDAPVPNMIARIEVRSFRFDMNEVSLRVWGKMQSGEENLRQRSTYERLCSLVSHIADAETAPVRVLSTKQEVADYTEQHLLNPDRRRPVIVITPLNFGSLGSWFSGKPKVEPSLVLKRFGSVADVVSIQGEKSTFALSKVLQQAGLTKKYSCFDGGIRVYSTPLDTNTTLLHHPLLTKFRLRKMNAAQVLDNIEAALGGLGVHVAQADDVLSSLSSRSRPVLPEAQMPTPSAIETEENDAFGINKSEPQPPLVEVLDRIQQDYPTYLHVQKSAFRSARKCKRQVDVAEVAEMLNVLGKVARRWKENGGSLGATFALVVERELKSHQIPAKCVGNESDTTMNKFGNSRVFDGRQMQAHVTYKRRDFQRCLHLFFEADAELGIVLIGYLGDHLDN